MSKNVSIYLSKDELSRLEEARSYGVLNGSAFLKVLIKNGLDELEKSPKMVFVFDKEEKFVTAAEKTKVVRLDRQQYEAMERICKSTPFSMSSLAKYFIMPQINAIVERKEWNYRP